MKRVLLLSGFLLSVLTASAVTYYKDSVSLKVKQLTFSPYEDFSAVPFGEKLIYVSSRNTDVVNRSYSVNDQAYFQLFSMDLNSHKVSDFKFLKRKHATKFHSGPIAFLTDSSGAFFSRNYVIPNLDDAVNFYIGFVDFETGKSYRLPFIRRAFNYQHPYYDDANRRLYFASDMPGGQGGYDIYYSEVGDNGEVGEPINVKEVNSSQNELFPTTNKSGELLFSRRFKDSGLDILKLDSKSDQIIRLPSPFNSNGDDHSLIFLQGDSAVYTQGVVSKFNSDVYLVYNESKVKDTHIDIEQNSMIAKEDNSLGINNVSESKVAQSFTNSEKSNGVEAKKVASVSMETVNTEDQSNTLVTGETKSVATVSIFEEPVQPVNIVEPTEMDVIESAETMGSTKGEESIHASDVRAEESVQSGNIVTLLEMDVLATSESMSNSISTSNGEGNLTNEAGGAFDWSSSWDKSFTLAELYAILPKLQLEQERTHTFNYASGHKQLTESQLLDLSNLIAHSGRNILSVSIEGHTDNSGSAAINYKIALQRALEVRKALTQKFDIPESKMSVVSWGESLPKYDCVDCDESEAKENRRVEVKITEKVWIENAALMRTIESRAERLLLQDSLAFSNIGSVYSPNATFKLSDLLNASELNLSVSRFSKTLTSGTVYFGSGQVYLSSEEQAKLKEELSKVDGDKLKITLVAHNDGIGDFASNKERSLARAMEVQYFLNEQLKGFEIAFEVEIFDDEFPAVKIGDGSHLSRLAANENRRVEFWIEPVQEKDFEEGNTKEHIYFDFDAVNVKSSYADLIKNVALKTTANEEIVLIGYTDSRGSEIYNYGLSLKRAQEVQSQILSINPELSGRIRVVAKGETGASTAKTLNDHALNRKVEIIKTTIHE